MSSTINLDDITANQPEGLDVITISQRHYKTGEPQEIKIIYSDLKKLEKWFRPVEQEGSVT